MNCDALKNTHSSKKYGLKPRFALKGTAQRAMWSKFLQRKKQKPYLSWKDYLLLMEDFDPLAMAIIKANKKMIDAFSLPRRNTRPILSPRLKRPCISDGMLEAHDMGAFEEAALTLDDV
jgi:hypothetical protein